MSFVDNPSARQLLDTLAVHHDYSEAIKYSKLSPSWKDWNFGRPENEKRVEDAIEVYASQFANGSAAPAVVLHRGSDGLEVLDGMQRLHANDLVGNTEFAGYIVTCEKKTARKIRRVANMRMNGSAPVDQDWTVMQLVKDFMIDDDDSAEEIASLAGVPIRRVQLHYNRFVVEKRIGDCFLENGKQPVRLKAKLIDLISELSEECDWQGRAGKICSNFITSLHRCKYNNGDATPWIKEFWAIRRTKSKKLETQLQSKLANFKTNPIIEARLSGKKSLDGVEKIARQLKSLNTVVKEYMEQDGSSLSEKDLVVKMHTTMGDTCGKLRQLCTTKIRRDIDPFNYR